MALFRIRVGREIGSAALVADAYHARADGHLHNTPIHLAAERGLSELGAWVSNELAVKRPRLPDARG